MDEITFAARISKQGVMKVIVIPKKIHKELKNINGQVIIKLSPV